VTGEPGIGKTRLVREALDPLDRPTIWITATSALARIPFGAVAHLVPRHVPLDAPPIDLLRAVVHHLEDVADPGNPARALRRCPHPAVGS
jgi:predicted ATPase